MLFEHRLGSLAYPMLNALGVAAAALCAAVLIFLEWRRRRQTEAPPPPPDAQHKYNPFYYLSKERRKQFNPIIYMMYAVVSYGCMQPGVWLTGLLLNVTKIAGQWQVYSSGVVFASGVLVGIPIFLLFARFFPGNGRPTVQLEIVTTSMALTHVFNRMACFLNGCCFGIPCSFGIIYPDTALPSTTYGAGTRLFPNQLLESAIMLVCFIVILILRARGKRTLPIFPLVFGATGFLLGFVMNHKFEPLKPILGFVYPGPFAHLLVFILGLFFLFLVLREKKKSRGAQGKSVKGAAEGVSG